MGSKYEGVWRGVLPDDEISVIGDGLKLTLRFENTAPGHVSAPVKRRKTVAQ